MEFSPKKNSTNYFCGFTGTIISYLFFCLISDIRCGTIEIGLLQIFFFGFLWILPILKVEGAYKLFRQFSETFFISDAQPKCLQVGQV